jgi:uncharacterized membrane protein
MQAFIRISSNIILFLILLLLFLLTFESRIQLPVWLQVAGRLHPLLVHLPIGLLVFTLIVLLFQNQFRRKQLRKIILLCLVMASLCAVLAVLPGLFLSLSGEYGEDALRMHKMGGVILTLVCYIQLLWFRFGSANRQVFYGLLFITFLMLVYAGHTGSILTHGENYILAPLKNESAQYLADENAPLYHRVVLPVLEKKCFSCHNESKAKGRLIMTSVEKFKAGGKSGIAWVPGNPDSSRIIQFLHLPLEHDNHMPPDGKPQLSSFEKSVLEAWISAGADFTKKLDAYADTDTLVTLANIILQSEANGVPSVRYTFTSASPKAIEKLNTPFRTITPLYQNSPALQVDFFIKESYQSAALQELTAVKEQVVTLNLSKMPVTDDDLKVLGELKNLEKLNLNFTSISGAGLNHLASLGRLTSLALSGTSVTRGYLEQLLQHQTIQEIFIWNTRINEQEKIDLEEQYPNTRFVHQLFTESGMLALSKPQLVNEGVIRRGEWLNLRHTLPGVVIRYSLDGTPPDSVSGLVYDKPLSVAVTTKMKAIACKPGWYCSGLLEETVFVEGYKPERVALLAPPDKQYPGEGASSLTDLRKGFPDIFKEPSWLGYRDNAFEAGFDFGSTPPALQKIVIGYGDNLGAYIFPPVEVEVWGGKDEHNLSLIQAVKPHLPEGYRSNSMEALAITFEPTTFSYYKIVARPISRLPDWHGGKGQKGWFFVDEVFFY